MTDRKQKIAGILENITAVYQAMIKIAPTILNELGITHTQMFILSFIKQNKDVSLKKLAGTMGITSSAATQQVNNLVKKGYLVREESNVDRRMIKIHLSPKMDKQIEKIEAMFLDQLCDFFNVINDEELEIYYKLHSRIANQIMQK
jgi:DNA-binding MarR family transcriptional regulator